MRKTIYSLVLISLFSCGVKQNSLKEMKVEGLAQGTSYHITYISKGEVDYQRQIDSLLIEIDNSLSTYQPRSIISRLNKHEKNVELDSMFKDVFVISKKVYNETEGAFDPTIAPVVNAWGFGFKNSDNTDSLTIDSLMQFVGFENIELLTNFSMPDGVMLDFNAVAQGYSVDVLANFLKDKGITDFLVEVGGELITSGKNIEDKLWRVGIDRPEENLEERELEAIISLKDKALATSGNYRKFYEKDGMKYAHTINPKTGFPVQHNLLSVTIVANNCGFADAYATAFMVIGLEKSKAFLQQHPEIDAFLIYSDENGGFQTFVTKGLEEYIELNNDKK
jgi:thiamine biosynthesis lipoprotein